jgi:hypothetical protein
VDAILVRARELKQAFLSYVFDAEGEIATALEAYSAEQLARAPQQDIHQRNLVIDRFLTEGRVGSVTPLDLFIEDAEQTLSVSDKQLLQSWHRTFIGLFSVVKALADGFELMNWLTAKTYVVKLNDTETLREMQKFKTGEILLARISPVTTEYWMFSGPCLPMGNLGKPKLAVAIGNFKQNYRESLYSDAPELLEEAWRSVERYHHDFVDFFGSDEVILPGYQLSKKLAEFQEIVTKKRLAEAGVDETKSLAEMADEAGIDDAEIQNMAETLGVDSKQVSSMLKSQDSAAKMVAPKIELPAELRKAENVTVLAHPRWGQMFLPTYTQFKQVLIAEDWQAIPGAEPLVQKSLEDPTMNAFVWRRLAAEHPAHLEKVLQSVLNQSKFDLQSDLDAVLQRYHKALEPELPEIASVPLHLHNLFQEALAEVNKSKPKEKAKPKKGFQRK